MKIECYPIGDFEENSYLLREGNEVVFIDPGKYGSFLISKVKPEDKVVGILLTHGHDDHTGAVDDLVDEYHCPVYIHKEDESLIKTVGSIYAGGSKHPITSPVSTFEDSLILGNFKFKIYHTPGHTSGSVLIRYKNVLFTGDTLFANDIGRTDLYSGNDDEMNESLKFINTLESDLIIYPGHGPSSTIGQEKMMNYYLNHTY